MLHLITVERNAMNPGLYRATCSCGWSRMGTQLECQLQASVHDLHPNRKSEDDRDETGRTT
jgi:hypothetical protein